MSVIQLVFNLMFNFLLQSHVISSSQTDVVLDGFLFKYFFNYFQAGNNVAQASKWAQTSEMWKLQSTMPWS